MLPAGSTLASACSDHLARAVSRVEQRLGARRVRFGLLQFDAEPLRVPLARARRGCGPAHSRLAHRLRSRIEGRGRDGLNHRERLPRLDAIARPGLDSQDASWHRRRDHEPPPQPRLAFFVDGHVHRGAHDGRGFHLDHLRGERHPHDASGDDGDEEPELVLRFTPSHTCFVHNVPAVPDRPVILLVFNTATRSS